MEPGNREERQAQTHSRQPSPSRQPEPLAKYVEDLIEGRDERYKTLNESMTDSVAFLLVPTP
jgi:hypothetical protein